MSTLTTLFGEKGVNPIDLHCSEKRVSTLFTFLPAHGLAHTPHQLGRGGFTEHVDLIGSIPVHMEIFELDVMNH